MTTKQRRRQKRIERRQRNAAARAVRRESTAAVNRLLFQAIGVLPSPAERVAAGLRRAHAAESLLT